MDWKKKVSAFLVGFGLPMLVPSVAHAQTPTSAIGESIKQMVEEVWAWIFPLVLPHYNKEDLVFTVIFSLVCTAATMAIAYWGKLGIVVGPRLENGFSKLGVIVSLPLVVLLGFLLFWKVLGFLWGLVPAPFGIQWIKTVILWLIRLFVPIAILYAIVKSLIFSPMETLRKVKGAFDAVVNYLKKGWSNREAAPLFTALGGLGFNYVLHHEAWSNKEVYYWPSILVIAIGLVTTVHHSVWGRRAFNRVTARAFHTVGPDGELLCDGMVYKHQSEDSDLMCFQDTEGNRSWHPFQEMVQWITAGLQPVLVKCHCWIFPHDHSCPSRWCQQIHPKLPQTCTFPGCGETDIPPERSKCSQGHLLPRREMLPPVTPDQDTYSRAGVTMGVPGTPTTLTPGQPAPGNITAPLVPADPFAGCLLRTDNCAGCDSPNEAVAKFCAKCGIGLDPKSQKEAAQQRQAREAAAAALRAKPLAARVQAAAQEDEGEPDIFDVA